MNQLPLEYWIYFQLGIDIALIMLILFFLRYLRKTLSSQPEVPPTQTDDSSKAKQQIDTSSLDVLTSLMETAKDSSAEFDRLIQEKKMLIAVLDEKLELKKRELIRIIKKGEVVTAELRKCILDSPDPIQSRPSSDIPLKIEQKESENEQAQEEEKPDQTEAIMELASRGLESHAISARLSIPMGEVELILGLNKIIKNEGTGK